MIRTLFILLLSLSIFRLNAQTDTLVVNYVPKSPFATKEKGVYSGIDVDILNEYVNWLKVKKNVSVFLKMNEVPDEPTMYGVSKTGGKNCMAAGALKAVPERQKEFDHTTGYLKNVAVCITNGNAPDVKTKTSNEIIKALGSMTGLTIPATSLANYMNEIKKLYINDLKIKEMSDQNRMLDEVSKNVLNFTYVDAVIFWFYLKNNPQKFLKMQKPLSQDKDQLSFLVPKGSQHKALFNEFFAGPGGFKTQKNYRTILEKYLGSYMGQNMAVN